MKKRFSEIHGIPSYDIDRQSSLKYLDGIFFKYYLVQGIISCKIYRKERLLFDDFQVCSIIPNNLYVSFYY